MIKERLNLFTDVAGAHLDVCTVTGLFLCLDQWVQAMSAVWPLPLPPVHRLHKSIFVIAGCVEQTDTVLYWSSCRPSSLDHQRTICLFLCLFSFFLFLSSFSPLFASFFLLFFAAERGQRVFKAPSKHAFQTLQPQNLCEGEYAGKGISAQH